MKVKLIAPDIRGNYVEELLKARGVNDVDKFLNPTKDSVQSWEALDNIYMGMSLIQDAISNKRKTLLIVDCDCDGYCSSTIMYKALKAHGLIAEFICHEAKQHGLEDIVKRIDLAEYDLVILPDAGTNDDRYFNCYPTTNFLVLDHHDRSDSFEEEDLEFKGTNFIVINNQLSRNYLNKSLCGAGVTWQFIRAMDVLYNTNLAEDMIDLTAFATIADVMKITTSENRYIIQTGLSNIQNDFLNVLVDKQSFSLGQGPVTPIGLAFYVIPLINSMCRTGTLDEKERMFLAFIDGERQVPCLKRGAKGTTEKVSVESARECTNTKSRQTKTQEKMTELAKMQIINDNLLENKILIITLDDGFDDIPSEINGLTATKLANEYKHPTIVARVNKQGFLRGSMRGLSTLDMPGLKEFFQSSGLFEYVEGHSLAAGISIPVSKVSKLHEWANKELKDLNMNEDVWGVDFCRSSMNNDISEIIFSMNEIKHTWGQGNPEPLIYISNINITESDISVIGKGDTVKITKNGIIYMFFKQTQEQINSLTKYKESKLEVVGTMNVNEYYGKSIPQIFVKDCTIQDGYLLF